MGRRNHVWRRARPPAASGTAKRQSRWENIFGPAIKPSFRPVSTESRPSGNTDVATPHPLAPATARTESPSRAIASTDSDVAPLGPHPPNSGPNGYTPCSVPTQKRPLESTSSARARLTHPFPVHGGGAKSTCHVRPPLGEWANPLRVLIQRFGPGNGADPMKAVIASTY